MINDPSFFISYNNEHNSFGAALFEPNYLQLTWAKTNWASQYEQVQLGQIQLSHTYFRDIYMSHVYTTQSNFGSNKL